MADQPFSPRFAAAAFLLLALLLSSCKKEGTASARCASLQTFQSPLGVLNVPQLPLGALLWANQKTKRAGFITVMKYPAEAKTVSGKENYSSKFETKLEITFSANVPESLKVVASTYIKNSASMDVTELQRTSLNDVAGLLSRDPDALAALEGIIIPATDDVRILAVHAVGAVSQMKLGVANATRGEAGVNVLKLGDFEMNVTYECGGLENIVGSGVDAFFKVTTLRKDGARYFLDPSTEISLADYDLTAGARDRP